MFLYQIPKYHFELPGLKKPNSKTSPDETKVWLAVRGCVKVMVSMAAERIGKREIEVKKQMKILVYVGFFILQLERDFFSFCCLLFQ